MEEKREIKQEKIYDENGKLKYVVIPNYTKTDYFMSKSEIKFYRVLILAITEIREKYKLRLEIFPQVAINRLIKQNNRREKDLEKDLFAKSIDFVLYNKEKEDIHCCIELDGPEHKTNPDRIQRDIVIDNMFNNNIRLIRQDVCESYDINNLIDNIMKK
jgi:hypothetical protein